ncbi:methyl-accepting chemotaxis protein [Bradyrhizobium vignae]|uniref:methyl-accepting chemotaxis protein n=1 Tax=Bradyrhizobium vignae TaxID=1549949 RepID=UPI00100A730F|nr:HAMP domain-containing methyl-accepting chemotaxis protein [Bradyrhizobium vignae]RXG83966.1 methyl-accepting chemotaxis protein [Bradyrhizobium vignae]
MFSALTLRALSFKPTSLWRLLKLPSLANRTFSASLRLKIGLLGIIAVIATGSICLVGLNRAAQVQGDADEAARVRDRFAALSQSFLESQHVTTEFLRRRDDAMIERHAELLKQEMAMLGDIEAFAARLAEGDPLKSSSGLRSGIDLYAARFQNIVSAERALGFNGEEGLQGGLRIAELQLKGRLAELDQPRLTALMETMRGYEKDFMLHGEEKCGQDFDKSGAEFAGLLAASDLLPGIRAELEGLLKSYQAAFSAFMLVQQSLNDEMEDIAKVYGSHRPALAQAIAEADRRSAAAGLRAANARDLLFWLVVGAMGLVATFAMLFGHRIGSAISRMTAAMRQLGAGQFEIVLPGLDRKDEIGDMGRAVEDFKHGMRQKAERDLAEQLERDRLQGERSRAELVRLADGFEAAVGNVIETVANASCQLESAALGLTQSAKHTTGVSSHVSTATDSASSNIQLIAAATEQMMTSASEIGRQVQESSKIALEAVRQATQTDRQMSELTEAAERIGDVVRLIAKVARQTNLLALNATIEAARAGEYGTGFAVVAQEVKALADQTSDATSEIAAQIGSMQSVARKSVIEIASIGATIDRISQISGAVSESVEQQLFATREIAQNIQQTVARTSDVASGMSQVAHAAGTTDTAASGVLQSAQALSKSSSKLKAELSRFTASLRRA